MSKLNLFKTLLIAVFFSTLITSCKDDEVTEKPTNKTEVKYIVAFQENKIGDAENVDYVLELDNLTNITKEGGSFDVDGKGILQTGWRFFHQAKNTLFTAGYSTDVSCTSYQLNNDVFKQNSRFTFDSTLDCFTTSEDGSKMIAVQLSHSGLEDKTFYIVDVASGRVEKKINHPIDIDKGDGTATNPGSIPWVSGMVQKGNKLYVSYFKWDAAGKYTTPASDDKAKVAIFNYPAMTLDKIIETTQTGPLGINGGDTGIVKAENGDMYTYSCLGLSAGFTSTTTKKSGIVKIKNDTDSFDEDYFFNVEDATNGGKIYWMQYIGNGKALARLILDDTKGAYEWGAFLTKDALKMVVLDLKTKTVTDVQGVPNPQGQRYVSGTGLLIEDGKVYTGITNPTETAVYIIDVETATAKKGAVATNARSLKGIFKLEK